MQEETKSTFEIYKAAKDENLKAAVEEFNAFIKTWSDKYGTMLHPIHELNENIIESRIIVILK